MYRTVRKINIKLNGTEGVLNLTKNITEEDRWENYPARTSKFLKITLRKVPAPDPICTNQARECVWIKISCFKVVKWVKNCNRLSE